MNKSEYRVLVLDMQPIDPPVGGGRLRLLGLYHNLGSGMQTTYIGTYDWPGERFRNHALSSTLREIDIPLNGAHFEASRILQEKLNGKTIIDATFHQFAHHSPHFVDRVRKEVVNTNVVVFSHPWIHPLVKDLLREDQLVVYDSHNVEGLLRTVLLDDGGIGTGIVKDVVRIEHELCHTADMVLACSHEDMTLFNRLYDVPFEKMRVVPNGVFTEKIKPAGREEKAQAKQRLGLENQNAAIFIGSNYPPNVEAAQYIAKTLAPQLPGIMFIIAGGVGGGIDRTGVERQENVRVTGLLGEDQKQLYLAASDVAINPMFSGSGTNIKMFDFMAAGLPVIATGVGARGIADTDYAGILVNDRYQLVASFLKLLHDPHTVQDLGQANRRLVERAYSWESISPQLGILFGKQAFKKKGRALPTDKREQKKVRLAVMTTWNIRCGVAEYSSYLIDAFEAKDVEVFIIANTNTDRQNSHPITDISRNVYKLWDYDYVQWKNSAIDIEGILHLLRYEAIPALNIQYHPGFFNHVMLKDLVNRCVESGIEVCITLHNAYGLTPDALRELGATKAKIVVLAEEEKRRLDGRGINNIFYLPLGVLEFPDEDKDDVRTHLQIQGFPVIGSFGFMRQYKGVMEAIEAIGILRNTYPNIVFLGIHALYPSEDSEAYYQQCKQRIDALGLHNNVLLKTDFSDIQETIHYLHACDIVVLPYHESKESASGAANIVLAAKRPLIISRSEIFNDIKNIGRYVDNIEPATLASEIQSVLSSPALLNGLTDKVMRYVEVNSLATIARYYIETICRKDPIPPDYEMLVQKVYESILEDGDTAVDVGAHIGRHTIPIARKVFPHGRVFAFEPLPVCRKNMLHSMKKESPDLLSLVSVLPFALSNYEGESEFTVATDALGYSGLRERKYDCETRTEKIRVTVKKMDNVLEDVQAVTYIKIDAEGGEFDIMKGCTKIIQKFRPLVTFEFGLSSYAEYAITPAEVFNFWHDKHYQIYDILGNPLNEEKAFTNSAITQNLWDYIAIPEENTALTGKVIEAISSTLGGNGR